MPYGWVGSVLYVDLSTGEVDELDTMKYAQKYIGGRGVHIEKSRSFLSKAGYPSNFRRP